MQVWIPGVAGIFYYAFMYLCMGVCLPDKRRPESLPGILLSGFALYYALFEIIALPLKAAHAPLRALSLAWLFVCAAAVVFAVWRRRPVLARLFAKKQIPRAEAWALGLYVVLFVLLSLVLVLNANHLSLFDVSYYVGTPVTSVQTGTIELFDAYTGDPGNDQFAYYFLNTATAHSAVLFQVFNLHPLLEANVTLSAVGAGLLLTVFYAAGMRLFAGSRIKSVILGTAGVFVLYFLYSLSGTAMYFYFRPYEGKAMCSYLFPLMLLYFFLLWRDGETAAGGTGMFLLAFGTIAFTNSAIFVVAAMLAVLFVPYILETKKWKAAGTMLLLMLPDAVWFLLHTLIK